MFRIRTDNTEGGAFLYLFSRFRFAAGFVVGSCGSDRQDSSEESSAPGYGTWKARSYWDGQTKGHIKLRLGSILGSSWDWLM